MAEKKKTRGRVAKSDKPTSKLSVKLKAKSEVKSNVVKPKVAKKVKAKATIKEPIKEVVVESPKAIKPIRVEKEKKEEEVIQFFKDSIVEPKQTIDENIMSDIKDPIIDSIESPTEPTTTSDSKGQSWSPFGDNIESKTYRTPPVASSAIADISEPMFAAPTYDEIIQEENAQVAEAAAEGQPDQPSSAFSNEALADGSAADNKGGAEHLAKTVMGVYKGLNGLLINKTKVSERDMLKKSEEYGFPIHQTAPVDATTRVSYSDVIESYNQQVDESLEYDDDFHAEAEPLMTQIFETKNIGMSPEQRLGFLFVQDIGMKLYMMKEMKDRVSDLTEYFATVHQKESGGSVEMQSRPEEDVRERRPDPIREEEPQMEAVEEDEPFQIEPQQEPSMLSREVTVEKHSNLTVNQSDLKVLDTDG
tara:strand:- start:8784 stop:10040 length:1257 start_codon:yes stop_codon:yes gene_type:complete